MNPPTSDKSKDAIRLQVNGMAAIAKLMEMRIANDIAATEAALHIAASKTTLRADEGKQSEEANPMLEFLNDVAIGARGVVDSVSKAVSENKQSGLREQIQSKKAWLERWRKEVWEGIGAARGNVPLLQERPLEECMAAYAKGPHGEYERFSLLQEAILAPVYTRFEGMSSQPTELVDIREQAQFVARRAGFPSTLGRAIYDDSDKFVKEAQNYWGKILTVGAITALTLTTITLVAALPIAGIIGGAAGLSGAAAVSHGLALLGGGALAAGGLGMQGGLLVLGASGAVLGGGSGVKATSFYLSSLPKEAVTVAMCKLVNYLKYLESTSGAERPHAQSIKAKVINGFLESKHTLEREMLTQRITGEKGSTATANFRVLNFTLLKIMDIKEPYGH